MLKQLASAFQVRRPFLSYRTRVRVEIVGRASLSPRSSGFPIYSRGSGILPDSDILHMHLPYRGAIDHVPRLYYSIDQASCVVVADLLPSGWKCLCADMRKARGGRSLLYAVGGAASSSALPYWARVPTAEQWVCPAHAKRYPGGPCTPKRLTTPHCRPGASAAQNLHNYCF